MQFSLGQPFFLKKHVKLTSSFIQLLTLSFLLIITSNANSQSGSPLPFVSSVEVLEAQIMAGEMQQCTFSAMTPDATLPVTDQILRTLLVDLSSEEILDESEEVIVFLEFGTKFESDETYDTTGFLPGKYDCVLQALVNEEWVTVASEIFEIIVESTQIDIDLSSKLGNKGRILILLDDDHKCTDEPLGPNNAPNLLDQKQLLESLLQNNGWSYTITMGIDDFMKEQRTGAYSTYLLLSELIELPHYFQKEMREAVYRGDGLIEAGRRVKTFDVLNDAFAIDSFSQSSKNQGLSLKDSELSNLDNVSFTHKDQNVSLNTQKATVVAEYMSTAHSGSYSNHSYHHKYKNGKGHYSHGNGNGYGHHKCYKENHNSYDSHKNNKGKGHYSHGNGHGYGHHKCGCYEGDDHHKNKKGKGHYSHGNGYGYGHYSHNCSNQEVIKKAAITTHSYGHGKSVYMGFDVLMEAQSLGVEGSVFANLILNALDSVSPDFSKLIPGTDVPVVFHITNNGDETEARFILPIPEEISVVDVGEGVLDADKQTVTWDLNLAQSDQQSITIWVQAPKEMQTLAAFIETGDVDSPDQQAETSLDLNPEAEVNIDTIIASVEHKSGYSSIVSQLKNIKYKLSHKDYEWALKLSLNLTNSLNDWQKHYEKNSQPQIVSDLKELRLNIDFLIKQIAQKIVYGDSQLHQRDVLRGDWYQETSSHSSGQGCEVNEEEPDDKCHGDDHHKNTKGKGHYSHGNGHGYGHHKCGCYDDDNDHHKNKKGKGHYSHGNGHGYGHHKCGHHKTKNHHGSSKYGSSKYGSSKYGSSKYGSSYSKYTW